MTPGAIARRYGRALFESSVEDGSTADVGAGLAELADAVSALDPGTLAPGLLSPEQREQLASSLVSRLGSDSLIGRFVGVLAANDRLDQLPAIQARFRGLEDTAAGRIRVHIRAATELTDDERSTLTSKFETMTGRQVVATVEVDPALLGGVTVEAEGRVYDGSVRTQLTRLEREMAGQ